MRMSLLACLFALLIEPANSSAAGPEQAPCPHCEGQIVYRDVVSHRCKLVPDKKQIKKTVYEVREVPFCLHKLPPLFSHHHDCCDEYLECDCPRYKKVLIKKGIVCEEICGTKCVIEEFVERIPCRVCAPHCPSCAEKSLASPLVAPPLVDQELIQIPLPVVTNSQAFPTPAPPR
jgi:hypothetical protein